MAAALELLEAGHREREAHEHLMRECPWYRHVTAGGRDHPDIHCRPAAGESTGLHEGGALVKFSSGPTLTKAEARYTGTGGTENHRCGQCTMLSGLMPPDFESGRCTLVKGLVDAETGVCAHFELSRDVKLTPRTPEASTVVKPTVPPGGPGLFRMKGHHLPPYIEHLYPHLVARYGKHEAYRVAVGVVKKWAAGVNPGGYKTKSGKGKRTHPDVRAAAARNVAEWEKEKAEAHARHGGEAKASAVELANATAPGARPFPVPGSQGRQYGLYQNPVQSIAPSPPLPPLVALPTAAEVRAVIPLVPESSKPELSATARKFLEQAAYKLSKDNPLEALAVMRSAETALHAAHKADQLAMLPSAYTANVFAVPAAAQSSATSAMKTGHAKMLAWRKAELALGALADRIRKRYFHGVFNGPSQMARLTEGDVTALEKLAASVQPERSALDVVLVAVGAGGGAGGSAGTTAGRTAGRVPHSAAPAQRVVPDAHQLHVEHLEHLHHLHMEHVAHLEHLHHLHVEHMEHLATHPGPKTTAKPKTATPAGKVPGGAPHAPAGHPAVPAPKPVR